MQSTGWDTFFGGWDDNKGTRLTADELNFIKTNGVDFTLVRNGAEVLIYINDVLKCNYTLTVKDGFDYATKPAALNIQYCQDQEHSNRFGFTLDIRESAPEVADGE